MNGKLMLVRCRECGAYYEHKMDDGKKCPKCDAKEYDIIDDNIEEQ